MEQMIVLLQKAGLEFTGCRISKTLADSDVKQR
jgi:hypothetical protein